MDRCHALSPQPISKTGKGKEAYQKEEKMNKYCAHAGVVQYTTPACAQYHLPGSYARQTCHQISV
jgi:stalled ribosome alternative rescue factor ArfA